MKICVVFPQPSTSRYVNKFVEIVSQECQNIADKGTTVEVLTLDGGVETIENRYDSEFNEPWVVKKCEEAEKAGADAVVIGYTFDGGLEAARQALTIPVLGPTQVSFSVATVLSERFSIITLSKQLASMFRKQVHVYGVGDRVASIRLVDKHIPDLITSRSKVKELVTREARTAIESDGAEAIVLGGTGLLGIAGDLTEELKVPVIDTLLTSIKYAEMLTGLRLSHSKLSYSR